MKCVSADIGGNAALAREIDKRHGRVDVVIANAGMSVVFAIFLWEQSLCFTT